jgi:hypothetical protein
MGPLDARGNPTYDWATAREVIPQDKSALGFDPNMAQHADDGSVYAFGWSKLYPSPNNNPFWMGGTTLVRFSPTGQILWAVPLPETCVGLDVIPGGGCVAGGARSAKLYLYVPDGLLADAIAPGKAMSEQSGWLDNHASVAVSRSPRDGWLDIFAEDDYVCRIAWRRVDDRSIQVVRGPVQASSVRG